jgi:predicted dehydrogenase
MSARVRIGVVGAGAISQQMHLTHLAELADRFEVVGVCDVSPALATRAAARFGARACSDHRSLLAELTPDAMLVAIDGPSEDVAIDALDAGAHVLVEKPMAWAPSQAARVEAAVAHNGRHLQIGYMKRYDPAVELAQRLIADMGPVRGGIVRCVAGPNESYVKDVIDVQRPTDVPAEVAAAHAALRDERLAEALGDGARDPALRLAYQLLLGIACHELSVLRGLLGPPLEVSSAQVWEGGRWLVATLRYPTASLTYTLGRVTTRTFDERIELYTDDETLELTFPSPFLEHAPTRLTRRRESAGGAVSVQERMIAGYEEAFRRELEAFHRCIVDGRVPRTPVAEGCGDAEILLAIVSAARERAPQPLTWSQREAA